MQGNTHSAYVLPYVPWYSSTMVLVHWYVLWLYRYHGMVLPMVWCYHGRVPMVLSTTATWYCHTNVMSQYRYTCTYVHVYVPWYVYVFQWYHGIMVLLVHM
jgi:hypothetical protein